MAYNNPIEELLTKNGIKSPEYMYYPKAMQLLLNATFCHYQTRLEA